MKNNQTQDPRVYGLLALYDLHTGFYKRALDGIPDNAAKSRLDTPANHMNWIAGSLVAERYAFAELFGAQMQPVHYELFRDHKGIDPTIDYPPLADYLSDWDRISPVLRGILENLTPEQLDAAFRMDGWEMPYFDFLSFQVYREANCIGQIALWRRLLNYPPLKYD